MITDWSGKIEVLYCTPKVPSKGKSVEFMLLIYLDPNDALARFRTSKLFGVCVENKDGNPVVRITNGVLGAGNNEKPSLEVLIGEIEKKGERVEGTEAREALRCAVDKALTQDCFAMKEESHV